MPKAFPVEPCLVTLAELQEPASWCSSLISKFISYFKRSLFLHSDPLLDTPSDIRNPCSSSFVQYIYFFSNAPYPAFHLSILFQTLLISYIRSFNILSNTPNPAVPPLFNTLSNAPYPASHPSVLLSNTPHPTFHPSILFPTLHILQFLLCSILSPTLQILAAPHFTFLLNFAMFLLKRLRI